MHRADKVPLKAAESRSQGPLRVFFDQYPYLGGGQRVLLNLIEAALSDGASVTAVIPPGGALEVALRARFSNRIRILPIGEPVLAHGRKSLVDVFRLLAYSLRMLRYRGMVRRARTVYVNGARQFPGAALLSLGSPARFFYHVHLDHNRLEKFLLARIARLPSTERIIVNSNYVRNRLDEFDQVFGSDGCTRIIENALDRGFAGRPYTDRFRQASGPLRVAVVGTIRPEKGQDRALALARLLPEIEIHILGPEGAGCTDWLVTLKKSAPANVIFHGPVDDVPTAMDRLRIQVNLVPSRWQEPFGLVAIEGMACSCLTIVSGSGALTEIADVTGAWVATEPDDIATAIKALQTMPPADQSAICQKQYRATMARYDPDRFIHAIASELSDGGCEKRPSRRQSKPPILDRHQ